MFSGEQCPLHVHTHTHTHRLGEQRGREAFTHAHGTIPICLLRQTPLLGFLGSCSCTNMWKRNVSLLSTGHTCNSIHCSHVQEIHQTGPISSHGEIQTIGQGGKSTLNSTLRFILIGLDLECGVRGSRGAATQECPQSLPVSHCRQTPTFPPAPLLSPECTTMPWGGSLPHTATPQPHTCFPATEPGESIRLPLTMR